MENKLISIILPVYNGEKFLAESIESCLNQTHHNIELIIVNDCSTDSTLEIASFYASKDNRIRIVNNTENKKLPVSLNIGHSMAKGDFITWTSDDNTYKLDAIEVLLKNLIKENVDIVYCDIMIIDHKGQKVRDVEFPNIENIIFRNYIGSCFLYKKDVFERNKGYNESYFLVEDYDFWLRAVQHSRFYQLRKNLYKYRKHDTSLTHQIAFNDEKKQLWNENIIKMYNDFTKKIFLGDDYLIMGDFLAKSLCYQKIPFEWIIKNESIIDQFKQNLSENLNFQNKGLIEKIFSDKIIHIMIMDNGLKTNFHKSIYIVKKYGRFLDKNAIKTLIKYSFFKK